jgi:hypothetical protein
MGSLLIKKSKAMRKRNLACNIFSSALCAFIFLSTMDVAAFAVFKKNANGEFEDINKAFRSATYWKGADGAMTIETAPGKTLWLFGDTWIVDSTGGPQLPSRILINNSVATQEFVPRSGEATCGFSRPKKSCDTLDIGISRWNFWFGGTPSEPASIFRSKEKGTYYWPGCGIANGGKLYLILKKIRQKENANPLFQFDWFAEDLLIVQNPMNAPSEWVYTIHPVSTERHEVQYGLACTKDQNYLYSLCYLEREGSARKKTILARVLLNKLDSISAKSWEYFCDSTSMPKGSWLADFQKAKNIIPDGGPEMSLFFHDGLKCFVSVYQPPLSPAVNLRVARKIEGPWSEPMEIFKVPERTLADGKTTALVYAGKAHECLSDGHTIIFSYCENPGGLEQHMANPDVYFPTVRTFTISDRSISKMLDAADVSAAKP